jgi:microcompartment protein CcmL/EutN
MSVLGMVEFSSIAVGMHASDAMVKAAHVTMLASHPIDPGRYMSLVTGDVASVEASVAAGVRAAISDVVRSFVLPNLHEQVLPAIEGKVTSPVRDALGVIETNCSAALIESADAACKASQIVLIKIRLALHLGGKGYTTFVGSVADVEAALAAGVFAAGGHLVHDRIIPNPDPDVYAHLLKSDDSR